VDAGIRCIEGIEMDGSSWVQMNQLQIAGMEARPNEESLYRFRKGSYVLYVTLAADCVLLDGYDYGFPPAARAPDHRHVLHSRLHRFLRQRYLLHP